VRQCTDSSSEKGPQGPFFVRCTTVLESVVLLPDSAFAPIHEVVGCS